MTEVPKPTAGTNRWENEIFPQCRGTAWDKPEKGELQSPVSPATAPIHILLRLYISLLGMLAEFPGSAFEAVCIFDSPPPTVFISRSVPLCARAVSLWAALFVLLVRQQTLFRTSQIHSADVCDGFRLHLGRAM